MCNVYYQHRNSRRCTPAGSRRFTKNQQSIDYTSTPFRFPFFEFLVFVFVSVYVLFSPCLSLSLSLSPFIRFICYNSYVKSRVWKNVFVYYEPLIYVPLSGGSSGVDKFTSIRSLECNFEGNKNRYRIRFIFLSGCVPLSRPNLITRRIGRASKEKLHVLSCSRAAPCLFFLPIRWI